MNSLSRKCKGWLAVQALALGCCLPGTAASAQDFDYVINPGQGTVTITGYTGPGGDVTIPRELGGLPVVRIGFAFFNCLTLTNVVIPDTVSSIASGAFASCYYLDSASLPNSLLTIEDQAFSDCGLTNVAIPDSVTSIAAQAFWGCRSLSKAMLGARLGTLGAAAFASCPGLLSLTVHPTNSAFSSFDGALFNKTRTTLIQFPGGKAGSYGIPNTVSLVGDSAFAGSSLSNVTVPASVTRIELDAFSLCAFLVGVYFQGSAPVVADAFYWTTNATVYFLPGTTGWGLTFAGRPARLWNPFIPANHPSFGVTTNRFGFTVVGTPDIPIVIEAAGSLGSVWQALHSCALTNGSIYFSDPQWASVSSRFYRIRSP